MKIITSLSVILCGLALLAGPLAARAEDKDEKKPCCKATVEAGKKCEHKCCVKAAEDSKVCEKCHPKKEDKQ